MAVFADVIIGDPVYPLHPVRLIGGSLHWIERWLRRLRFDGYGGGVLLFVVLAVLWLATLLIVVLAALRLSSTLAWIAHVALVYSFLALGDLLHHVWRIELALRRDDLEGARVAVGALVGRDTDRMDAAACRRAGVESLSENLTDGFLSAVFWYAIVGLPGLLIFKIASTMDSMVGFRTPEYLRFGWCGARLDDVMNFVPARVTWLLIGAVALVVPGLSARKAWRVGLEQHAVLLGPNAGWSEAAAAGALSRRIVGPIWLKGVLVTDVWVGDPADPPLASSQDVTQAILLVLLTGLVATALGLGAIEVWGEVLRP